VEKRIGAHGLLLQLLKFIHTVRPVDKTELKLTWKEKIQQLALIRKELGFIYLRNLTVVQYA